MHLLQVPETQTLKPELVYQVLSFLQPFPHAVFPLMAVNSIPQIFLKLAPSSPPILSHPYFSPFPNLT